MSKRDLTFRLSEFNDTSSKFKANEPFDFGDGHLYVRLPEDADGIVIEPGDVLTWDDDEIDGLCPLMVMCLSYYGGDGTQKLDWVAEGNDDGENAANLKGAHHASPKSEQTAEDIAKTLSKDEIRKFLGILSNALGE